MKPLSVGFDNWKKALQVKLVALKQTSAAVQLSNQKANEQKVNR